MVDGLQRVHHAVNPKEAGVEHHGIRLDAAPLSSRARLVVKLPVAVHLLDLIRRLFLLQFIEPS